MARLCLWSRASAIAELSASRARGWQCWEKVAHRGIISESMGPEGVSNAFETSPRTPKNTYNVRCCGKEGRQIES